MCRQTCSCFNCKVITNPGEIRATNLLCHHSGIPITPRRAWITTWPACLIFKSPLYLFFFVSHLPCDTPQFPPVSPEWILPFPPLTTVAPDILSASRGFTIGNTACPPEELNAISPPCFCVGDCGPSRSRSIQVYQEQKLLTSLFLDTSSVKTETAAAAAALRFRSTSDCQDEF